MARQTVASREGKTLRVLIVEDDYDARENLRDILELQGYAISVRAALDEVFETEDLASFDVIILDRNLPDGMVEDHLPAFRERAPQADLIVITGYADMDASIAALREGVSDYMIKPIKPDALLQKLREIHRRLRIERELREEQQFAEMVLQTAEAIVLVLDVDGRITRFNKYLAELTGHSLEEVEDHDWFDTFIPANDRKRIRRIFQETIEKLQTRGVLNSILTKSGAMKVVRWSNTVIKDQQGHATGVLSVGLDVTNLIAAQEQAMQSDRLATIGQTMAGMAHESRNALQRIRNSVELLEDEIGENPEALRYVEKISRAANDLRDLLEEVRSYAAPIKLELERAELPAIWRKAWASLEDKYSRAVLVDSSNGSRTPEAMLDCRRIEQVFRNLFENAFDACGSDVEVSIGYEMTDSEVIVTVRDNGPGMPEDVRRRVFDAFYTTKATGTGLGMAIAHRIIDAHGGSIEAVDSSRGTEFMIRLPLAAA